MTPSPPDFTTLNETELARLDALLASANEKWPSFYANRQRPCPFFVDAPDENLAGWLDAGRIAPGLAIDLGCGHGRNALHLAGKGFRVRAVDFSESAIAWARERVAASGQRVEIIQASVFEFPFEEGTADLVYDGGCFHHLAPHRRHQYMARVARMLRPGGHFGLVCFAPSGGSGFNDAEVYEKNSLGGGLGYDERRLRELWSPWLEIEAIAPMREMPASSQLFGKDFLMTMLARKK
ncbi:methyltransferase domain-containing protein [Chromobacterium piscinae]|uniref:methyltransferase domain-containing protein n=1 Tax=Chromobacterium piscinae TaxID=686831 RepID=UPI00140D8ACC|nr:class I SAM-dependent methyltransferase [Chromobacterium vaccinii]NHQ80210.1 class I SAM-dependent methyltransferase [Chromobacterium vaccinii]